MAMIQASINSRQALISSGDRLGLTVFFAVVLHSLIILGISFDIIEPAQPPQKLPGLEITLVQSKADKEIKDADFLAQASQEGGGESKEKVRPSTPTQSPIPQEEVADVQQTAAPPPMPVNPEAEFKPQDIPANPQPGVEEILTLRQSEQKIAAAIAAPEAKQETRITAAQLLSRSREIASLAAEIDQAKRVFAQRPKRKIISARTSEYRFASYEQAWRMKVERVGRINFPDEAKRQKLSGSLIMAVTINTDGSIKSLDIRRPSRHKILDDAALRIVRLAAPFSPFSKEMRKDTDELVIIRTWIFEAGKSFSAR